MRVSTRSSLTFLVLPLLLLAVGCEESSTSPQVEDDLFQPGHALLADGTPVTLHVEGLLTPGGGADVVLRLDNQSDERVGFNLCFHILEERDGESWVTVPGYESRVCTLVIHFLDPGNSANYNTTLPAGLEAGEYRFRVAVNLADREEMADVATEPFTMH